MTPLDGAKVGDRVHVEPFDLQFLVNVAAVTSEDGYGFIGQPDAAEAEGGVFPGMEFMASNTREVLDSDLTVGFLTAVRFVNKERFEAEVTKLWPLVQWVGLRRLTMEKSRDRREYVVAPYYAVD